MRVEFINRTGGTMYVDESRVNEYKAAGYKLAADIIDGVAIDITDAKPVEKKRASRKKKEV